MKQVIEIINRICGKTIDYALLGLITFTITTFIIVILHPEMKGTCIGVNTLYYVPAYLSLICLGTILGAALINIITIKRIKEEIKNGERS